MRAIFLLLTYASALFGQLNSNTGTVQATRIISVQPDQAVLSVSVTSDLDATLDDIVAAVQPAGVTAANFIGVTWYQFVPGLRWNFSFPVVLSSLKDTLASLQVLLANVPYKITFDVTGAQVSPQLQAMNQCSNTDLVADAKAQGQKLAAAGGFTAGRVLAVSNSPALVYHFSQSTTPL